MNPDLKSALLRVIPFAIIIFIMMMRLKLKKSTREELYLVKPLSLTSFLWWCGSFLILILVTECILYRFGLLEIVKWNHPPVGSVIRITGAVLLAPVAEELLFRGLFLQKLTSWNINKHLSVAIQSAVFVLMHNFTYDHTTSAKIAIAQGFMDACLFAYAKYQTKSIYTSMVMHSTGNLIATLERFIF